MDCYVYYKAKVEHEQEVIGCFQRLRSSLERKGISPILQRRPESKDLMYTWMEIYHDIPSNFETIIEAGVAESGVMTFVVGTRHAEHFVRV
ncbi:DUF4936 family protein [Undibacterium sp. LX40W]|uniref:DUF4936 family protein n=1 Tax=Undibacterium nitidum TaxID=2762298 RepID=A0A923KS21_9BURK|nr:DUF4936 family protein [Undibacterium nitidum]MBC3879989.1 DUF4936 family protein [Undibacterium nitidum]MBC3891275.1 DUF4936 family protein [Undibacterium sp. LX40W]